MRSIKLIGKLWENTYVVLFICKTFGLYGRGNGDEERADNDSR